MKIDVYDSYAQSLAGHTMHFDVFVESNTSAEQALGFGRRWLESIGESAEGLQQSRCNFCHSEIANPEVQVVIKNQGYFILQMEGCPAAA
jgi:hypothetical protein